MRTRIWKIVFAESALKEMAKLDRPVKERIFTFFEKRVLGADDPRLLGKRLTAGLAEYWSYRIGDYRALCTIHDQELSLIIIRVGHRRAIYE